MRIVHNAVATVLIATFFVGDAACLCAFPIQDDGEHHVELDGVRGEMSHHAHGHTPQSSIDRHPCPHGGCDGACASRYGFANGAPVLALLKGMLELDGNAAVASAAWDEPPFRLVKAHLLSFHLPPPRGFDTPVSQFDRLLD